MKKCSECGLEAVRVTCGSVMCQISRKRKRDRELWKKNGGKYYQSRKLKDALQVP